MGYDPIRSPQESALDALRRLGVRGHGIVMEDREPWRIGGMEPETAKDAAVLILFGVLDDAPATSTTGASVGVGADLDVLIVVRAGSLRQHAGQPAFPGGKVDPEDLQAEDSFVEAALREAVEETGLDRDGVEVLGKLAPVPLPVSNFMVTPVLGWWKDPSRVAVVDSAESSQVFRVPVRDLIDPQNRHYATVTRGPKTYRSPAFDVASASGPVTIWGFTGVVLDRVLHELGWDQDWDRARTVPAPM
ncbi:MULTISPECIES: NUDIX hydrolase [Micrococcaceae]|uniref:NUDIX hydrolase n=1 Tax=unclassified Kocuria TaxID=2649579 RepID=UPI0035303565